MPEDDRDPLDQDGWLARTIGVVFVVLSGYQAVWEVPGATNSGPLTIALAFAFFGTVLVTPSIRQEVAKGLRRVRFKITDVFEGGWGRATEEPTKLPEPEKDLEIDDDERRQVEQIERRAKAEKQEDVEDDESSPEELWKATFSLYRDGSLEAAWKTLRLALKKAPDDPKLLISAGAIQRSQGNLDESIAYSAKAREILGGRKDLPPEDEERYYLATSNLCFALAMQGSPQSRERAIRLGREAARAADRFEERDSFEINYAYALMRFARSKAEAEQAVHQLGALFAKDLSSSEVEEVTGYLMEGTAKLRKFRDQGAEDGV